MFSLNNISQWEYGRWDTEICPYLTNPYLLKLIGYIWEYKLIFLHYRLGTDKNALIFNEYATKRHLVNILTL